MLEVGSWINLGIEKCNYLDLAKFIIGDCEFEVRSIPNLYGLAGEIAMLGTGLLKPRFFCFTNEEKEDVLSGQWREDKIYTEELSYGFYFPNCTIDMLEKKVPEIFDETIISKIEKYFYDGAKLDFYKRWLYVAVFVVLHEYGHYLTYKRMEFDKVKYVKYTIDAQRPRIEMEERLKAKGNITEREYHELKKIYRECIDEKEADDYTLEHLEETMQRVVRHLKSLRIIGR